MRPPNVNGNHDKKWVAMPIAAGEMARTRYDVSMNTFDGIFYALTAITVTVKLLGTAGALQRKEYRLDRLRAAVADGEYTSYAYLYGMQLIAAGLAANIPLPLAAAVIAATAPVAEAFFRLMLLSRSGLNRPRPTAKAILLLTIAVIVLLAEHAVLTALNYPQLIIAAILLISTLPSALLAMAAVNRLGWLRKRHVIAAGAVLRRRLSLTVIGITGSYGKTSTKHFLGQLLPQAAVSSDHRNETYVIAGDMISQLTETVPQYITELGAYRQGEIASLAALIQPKIGVITAIGTQHLALFGSQQKITAAKWELVSALPADGIAVLNADDPRLKQQAAGYPGKIIWFSTTRTADVSIKEMALDLVTIDIRLTIAQHTCTITLPLAGRGALANVAAAAAAAWAAGAAPADICEKLGHILPYPRTMEVRELPNGATVIDDSYSANEHGALDAVEHLTRFPQTDKRVLLLPLIELGSEAARVHRLIGRTLAKSGAKTMLYTQRHLVDLAAGAARENPSYRIQSTDTPRRAVQFVTKSIGKDTVILLENRIPDVVRQELFRK